MGEFKVQRKRMILLIIVLGLAILLSLAYLYSRGGKDAQSGSTADFNFCLNFNTYGKDQIDTYKGTFTKDLVLDGTKTIDFVLPDDVKDQVQALMKNIDIMSFPEILKVEGMAVTPSCDYKLTVTLNGKTKTITWNEGFYPSMSEGLPQRNQDFLKLVQFISDYIYNTDAYKNMPKANGGYD